MKLTYLLTVGATFAYTIGYGSTLDKQNISSLTGISSRSTQGQEIAVNSVKVGPSKSKHRFLIQGGLHGNETLTSEFVLWLQQRLKRGYSPINKLDFSFTVDFVPYANPDSFKKYRNNLNGINLNRNFAVLWGKSDEPHGDRPFSEAETIAIRRLFETRSYTAAIDVHGYLNWVVLPSKPTFITRPHNVTAYRKWTKAISENISRLPSYVVKTAYGLGDGGAFEDWAFWKTGTLAFCLELKKPSRFFQYRSEKHFDSFLAYESFIAKTLAAAATIKNTTTPRVSHVNSSPETLRPIKKPSH